MSKEQRSFAGVPYLPDEGGEEWVKTVNILIEKFNILSTGLSLQSNFDSDIVQVSFTSGETKIIPHRLGVIPKYRIILRQEGNGVISDIPSGWTTGSIKLINNGAVAVTATIMIVRE